MALQCTLLSSPPGPNPGLLLQGGGPNPAGGRFALFPARGRTPGSSSKAGAPTPPEAVSLSSPPGAQPGLLLIAAGGLLWPACHRPYRSLSCEPRSLDERAKVAGGGTKGGAPTPPEAVSLSSPPGPQPRRRPFRSVPRPVAPTPEWGLVGPAGHGPVGIEIGLKPEPSVPGRHLLGLLLRPPLASPERVTPDQHLGLEHLGVVRPTVRYAVDGQLVVGLSAQLLEPGLVVLVARPFGRIPSAAPRRGAGRYPRSRA